jgi:hypothetical protein
MSVETPQPRSRAEQQLFIAILAAVLVFIGFAPTFYLNSLFAQRSLDALRIAHGIAFSLWPLLLLTQVLLVKGRRPDLHRRVGPIGVVLAVAMVILGTAMAIHAGRSGFQSPWVPPPPAFFAIALGDMAVFAVFVSAAVVLRSRRGDHSRLMVLATLAILPAAFGRLPIPGVEDPIVKAFVPGVALLFVCAVRDVRVHGHLHRAWLWGGLLFVLSLPLRFALASTPVWQRFSSWLIG